LQRSATLGHPFFYLKLSDHGCPWFAIST
jgi:hypothetical protein